MLYIFKQFTLCDKKNYFLISKMAGATWQIQDGIQIIMKICNVFVAMLFHLAIGHGSGHESVYFGSAKSASQ